MRKRSARISKSERNNFETLQEAFKNGDVCLLSVTRKKNGERVILICATNSSAEDPKGLEFIPFAEMVDGNPYDIYTPPV